MASDTIFSPKQFRLAGLAEMPERRIVVPGPQQCGKTFAASWGFFRFASLQFSGHAFMLCSRSLAQFNLVLLPALKRFAAEHQVKLRRTSNESWEMDSFIPGPPNVFYRALGSDSSSADRQYGQTVAGIFKDEYGLYPDGFNEATEARASVKGAKIVYTCNPQGPDHWSKTEYVDLCRNEVDLEEADDDLRQRIEDFDGVHIPFQMHDHPLLDEAYVRSQHAIYSGAMLRRMVYGEWAALTGMIWPSYENILGVAPPVKDAYLFELSADDASSGVCAALLWARYPNTPKRWVVGEWRHDGRVEGQLDPYQKARRMLQHFMGITGDAPIRGCFVDPAAASFRAALKHELAALNHGSAEVIAAENDVEKGIQLTDIWMASGRVGIDRKAAPELVKELGSYIWDPDLAKKGIDKPRKKEDHECDCFRYYCYSLALGEAGGGVTVHRG